jgi:hypothetical protein
MITSLYKMRSIAIDGIKITMIDSSLDKSQMDRSIYICSNRSIILYIYIYNNGRRIKESIRSKERAGKSHLFFFEHQLINRMKRMSSQRTKNDMILISKGIRHFHHCWFPNSGFHCPIDVCFRSWWG